jgi:nucleoside-diphosphate-sugar epimerase
LPGSNIEPSDDEGRNFEQDIVYDSTRLRRELGYKEPVAYSEGIRRTLAS